MTRITDNRVDYYKRLRAYRVDAKLREIAESGRVLPDYPQKYLRKFVRFVYRHIAR